MKHSSIPIFVPHLACPNDCVFCNQKKIAGTEKPLDDPASFLESAVLKLPYQFDNNDIAFFGGSFTGLSKKEMEFYLKPAYDILTRQKSRINGIRLSTRPDYISQDILDFLKKYNVTVIELGAQSMDDNVLRLSQRGHSSSDTIRASNLIKQNNFKLVLQFMPGLPGDTTETIYKTINKIAQLKPDAVRIYPCIVIKETKLEQMYYNGEFIPLTVDRAAEICADAVEIFNNYNINIIRMGLHSSDLVRNNSVVAGPFHPAFGEIVTQKIYYRNAYSILCNNIHSDNIILKVKTGSKSKMIGQKRCNILQLEKYYKINIKVLEDTNLKDYEIEVVNL